jgi:hypothetical protein
MPDDHGTEHDAVLQDRRKRTKLLGELDHHGEAWLIQQLAEQRRK